MYYVVKRDGKIVDFDLSKISNAIQKAFDSLKTPYNKDVIELIALRATSKFGTKIKDDKIAVEDIQDCVESTLSDSGYGDVAKAYILYRKKREDIRNANSSLLNYQKVMDDYLHVNDWRVKENSTVSYSLGGLILSNSGAITANYWLNNIYDKEIADAHKRCDFHIHDLSMLTPYCFTGDTKVLIPSPTMEGNKYSEVTFEELVENKVQKLTVYAFNAKTGKMVMATAINPRITRYVNKLVTVELSNGKMIKCTPDHLFMYSSTTYKKAEDLRPDDMLKSIDGSGTVTVVNVVHNQFEEDIPVYDLTVPEFENFAIEGNVFVHNCAGWNLKQLIQEGLGGVPGKITSKPAAHLTTLCNQMVNFLGITQNEWSGKLNWIIF